MEVAEEVPEEEAEEEVELSLQEEDSSARVVSTRSCAILNGARLTDLNTSPAADVCEALHSNVRVAAAVLADVLLDLGGVLAAADGLEGGRIRLGAGCP